MKNVISMVLLVTAIFAIAEPASAQHRKGSERISREQLAEKQARHISERLCFTPGVNEKFITTYLRYQQEVWALGPRMNKPKTSSMTETQADSAIQARFDHSQKLLNIQKKYYAEYSKFLTAKQIERVYGMERQMMKRLGDRRNSKRR